MPNPSNLYAEKIFAEHPLAIWPLDDQADYLSLISEDQRNITSTVPANVWTLTNCLAEENVLVGPIEETKTVKIIGTVPTSVELSKQMVIKSNEILNISEMSTQLETFSISSFIYLDTANIKTIEIGYQHESSTPVYGTPKPLGSILSSWALVSETFVTPALTDGLKIVFRVTYNNQNYGKNIGDPGYIETVYSLSFHAVTLGQWSEQFQRFSLGLTKTQLPASISITPSDAIKASQYGFDEMSGYYLIKDNYLRAKNFGVPLVYGSGSTTTIFPNAGDPSIIFPGLGFLNESGQYRDLTLEFWLRVNSGSVTPKRLCGPINSLDGLYVDGPFLKLKINNHVGSYFVGEWGRPMLLDFSIINNSANLLINGEQAISMNFITSELSFPDNFDELGKDQDWLGIYSYADIGPVQVDAIAIYPYQVNGIIAKRRFAYGQAVEIPQNINSSYNSTSVVADYSFANYSNNYNYPELGKWENGILDNIITDKNSLVSPNYELPIIRFTNKTNQEWLDALEPLQLDNSKFLNLKPNADWSGTQGHILFKDFNLLNQKTKAIYGVFTKNDSSSTNQFLFRFVDQNTRNSLDIILQGQKLLYNYTTAGVTETLLQVDNVVYNNEFAVGIDIDTFSKFYGKGLSSFFGNSSQINLYVGGHEDLFNTFTGNIYKIGFSNNTNFSKIAEAFTTSGVLSYTQLIKDYVGSSVYDPDNVYFSTVEPKSIYWLFGLDKDVNLFSHTSSYTLIFKELLSSHGLDIAISGSWVDYIPLSYLSKYVSNANNDRYYSIDFVQVNLDYPELVADEQGLYTTSNEILKTYVTFHPLKNEAFKPDSYYTTTIPVSQHGTVEPGSYILDPDASVLEYDQWATTKYEITNNSIVYPPLNVDDQSLGLNLHLEFTVDGIISKPIKIKSLQLASQAFNDLAPASISSKFGIPVYPYTKNGIYFDYKRKNPFSIYKGSSPHLYLTKDSGFKLKGEQKIGLSRGLTMPVNQSLGANYTVGAFQFSTRYDNDQFPLTAEEAFEIESSNSYIKFYLEASDSTRKRGKIYAFNTTTGMLEQGIAFYINGVLVNKPIIDMKEWTTIGIQFSNTLDFANTQGAFRITGELAVNNISHYQYTFFQENQISATRSWSEVLAPEGLTVAWQYWKDDFLWQEVLYVLTTEKKTLDPAKIYKIYMGTNKEIIEDSRVLQFGNYKYQTYDAISWQTETTNAV